MHNLGDYQNMTTLANKVGGPKMLAAIIFIVGITVGLLCAQFLKSPTEEEDN